MHPFSPQSRSLVLVLCDCADDWLVFGEFVEEPVSEPLRHPVVERNPHESRVFPDQVASARVATKQSVFVRVDDVRDALRHDATDESVERLSDC